MDSAGDSGRYNAKNLIRLRTGEVANPVSAFVGILLVEGVGEFAETMANDHLSRFTD
jgi:hypothetical protein